MSWTLDVTDSRVAIKNLTLTGPSGQQLHIDKADLDTGSAWAVIGPPELLDALVGENDWQPTTVLAVDDRPTRGRLFEATLELPDDPLGAQSVSVVSLPGASTVLIGLPVLRRFHLLLAPDSVGASLLVRP